MKIHNITPSSFKSLQYDEALSEIASFCKDPSVKAAAQEAFSKIDEISGNDELKAVTDLGRLNGAFGVFVDIQDDLDNTIAFAHVPSQDKYAAISSLRVLAASCEYFNN